MLDALRHADEVFEERHQLRKDKQLRRIYDVSKEEMDMLSRLVRGCDLGRIHLLRDLIFILNTIRQAVGR